MAQYLTLSRAARLVGTKRGALQKKIREGEIKAFEGMLEISELQKAYPNVELEDSSMLEKVDRFIENALTKKLRSETILPNPDTLIERLSLLSQELAAAKAEVNRYATLMENLKPKVAELGVSGSYDDLETARAFKSWFLHALEGEDSSEELPDDLLAREAFLRVMAAHVRVMPSGQEFFLEGSANILDAALRGGVELAYGCSDASCGRCKVKLVSGGISRHMEDSCNLTPKELNEGIFLSCCHTAVTDIVIDAPVSQSSSDISEQSFDTQIYHVERSGKGIVIQARYLNGQRLQFLSGQYARIQFEDGSSSEAGIASCPCDDHNLEFHISDFSNPGFWQYASNSLVSGQQLSIKGPYGDFVLDSESCRPLTFIAVDTGFGAIKSLVEHAMAINAADNISLYWATTDASKPYLDNLCRSWEDALDEFSYTPLTEVNLESISQVIGDVVLTDTAEITSHDIYICAPGDTGKAISRILQTKAGVPDERIVIEPLRAN